jgi:hypothetical protein
MSANWIARPGVPGVTDRVPAGEAGVIAVAAMDSVAGPAFSPAGSGIQLGSGPLAAGSTPRVPRATAAAAQTSAADNPADRRCQPPRTGRARNLHRRRVHRRSRQVAAARSNSAWRRVPARRKPASRSVSQRTVHEPPFGAPGGSVVIISRSPRSDILCAWGADVCRQRDWSQQHLLMRLSVTFVLPVARKAEAR